MITTNPLNLKKLNLRFDAEQHIHFLNDIPVTGVTKACDVLPKPALLGWAVKLCAEYIRQKWIPNAVYTQPLIEEILKAAKSEWRNTRDKAADKGTEAHEWINEYIKNKGQFFMKPSDPEILSAIDKFLDWESANKVEFLASEIQVGSEDYQFGGIVDLIAQVNGELEIIDFKTSAGIYYSHFIQLAGYQIALEEMGLKNIRNRRVLWIPKKGNDFRYELSHTSYLQDKEMFLACLKVAKKLKEYEGIDYK